MHVPDQTGVALFFVTFFDLLREKRAKLIRNIKTSYCARNVSDTFYPTRQVACLVGHLHCHWKVGHGCHPITKSTQRERERSKSYANCPKLFSASLPPKLPIGSWSQCHFDAGGLPPSLPLKSTHLVSPPPPKKRGREILKVIKEMVEGKLITLMTQN